MNAGQNHYELLRVKPTANAEEVKRAYKKAAKKYHPDRLKKHEIEEADRAILEAQFLRIQEAYELLNVPALRKEYDCKIFGDLWADHYNLYNQGDGRPSTYKMGVSVRTGPGGGPKHKTTEDTQIDWGKTACHAYATEEEQLDLDADDEVLMGEEVQAVWGATPQGGKLAWYKGTVTMIHPDGTHKIYWPAWHNYSDNVHREQIRRAGETEESARIAQKRHDKRKQRDQVFARWEDGKYYLGYIGGMATDASYRIYWPEFQNYSVVRIENIKFHAQIVADESRDSYTKYFETGDFGLHPEFNKLVTMTGQHSEYGRAVDKGEKFFKRILQIQPNAMRKDFYSIEEKRWFVNRMKLELGVEDKAKQSAFALDTSNPRGWSRDELIVWIQESFKKPTIVKKLQAYATAGGAGGGSVDASVFFTDIQKPGKLKEIGIKMKSLQRKVEAKLGTMNLRVW